MKKILIFVFAIILWSSCSTDPILKHRFAGKYEVRLDSPKSEREMKRAKRDIEKDINKAQKEIKKGVEDAKTEIERELGDDSKIKDALKSLVEGVGKMAEGLAELGEGLGELGLELGQDVLKGVKFNVDFKKNGEVVFGKGRSNDVKYWSIEKGVLYIWEYEDEKMAFEMKQKSAKEWELAGKEITFHLTEIK